MLVSQLRSREIGREGEVFRGRLANRYQSACIVNGGFLSYLVHNGGFRVAVGKREVGDIHYGGGLGGGSRTVRSDLQENISGWFAKLMLYF